MVLEQWWGEDYRLLPLNVKNLLKDIGYRLEHSAEGTGGESQKASWEDTKESITYIATVKTWSKIRILFLIVLDVEICYFVKPYASIIRALTEIGWGH